MKDAVKDELRLLSQVSEGGLLMPEKIVEYAQQNPTSALHGEFEWDDAKAAQEHRLQQAREMVRVYVTVLPGTLQKVRGFVSVPSDRANGGGYRQTEGILKNDDLRKQMVLDVLKRVEALRSNVAMLPELAPFFHDLAVIIDKHRAKLSSTQAA